MKELKIISEKSSYIKKLNTILKNGGVIAFVTDTVWGIGCLAESKQGVEKIYRIKNRDTSKPLILMSNKAENLYPYINQLPKEGQRLIDKYFPGALTIVTTKSDKTPSYITSGKNTVGIRVPDNEFFKELCNNIEGHVLATTSANISNEKSSKTYQEAINSIGKYVDITFEDYGYTCKGIESTVVLVTETETKILRQGAIKLN